MRRELAIINTRIGNLKSVLNALNRVNPGLELRVSDQPTDLESATALLLPGVGAFGDAMAYLHQSGYVSAIQLACQAGKPLLGICLGMQLLADSSDEHGTHQGLGLIPGRVRRLEVRSPEQRIPNMGWNPVIRTHQAHLITPELDQRSFYFAHSFHFEPSDSAFVAGYFHFGQKQIVAAVQKGQIYGFQFHPEKSQDAGLEALSHYMKEVKAGL